MPFDIFLELVVTGTRMASIDAKAADAKGSALRLIPSECATISGSF